MSTTDPQQPAQPPDEASPAPAPTEAETTSPPLPPEATPATPAAATAPPPNNNNHHDAAPAPAPNSVAVPSPPLPTRPTASTPGPRASRFTAVLASSLAHTLAKLSPENFAACYPTIAARAPATLRAVQKQMVDRLGALCRREFDAVLDARRVVARLNELEALVADAERRRDEAGLGGGGEDAPVPPHLLPADAVLAAHLAPHLALQRSQLNAKLQTTQAHNARLFADVQRQRAEMAGLVALLDKLFEDLDGANAVMDDVAGDLAAETRQVEAEIARAGGPSP